MCSTSTILSGHPNCRRTVVNKYAYSPYGRLLGQVQGISQPFKYAGQVGIFAESDTLLYMRARYYDVEVGRFISEDPAGFIDGPNLYAYVGENPIGAFDPSGLVNVRDLGFALIDFGISTSVAGGGVLGMTASPYTVIGLPATFSGRALMAGSGLLGMTNAGIDLRNALNETNNVGVFEQLGELLGGYDGARLGAMADLGTSFRAAAAAAGGMNTLSDFYDVISGYRAMKDEFGSTNHGS